MTVPRPYLALALAGPQVLELTSDSALRARWDQLPVAFTVLGSDRIDGSGPAGSTVSATVAAAYLAYRATSARVLVAASPQRDHPYNLARRVASLGHLSAGRIGLLLGVVDAYAPQGKSSQQAWGGANLGAGAPLSPETVVAAGTAIRSLEQGWPFEAFVGDRDTGILVQADQIVHSDIEGVYDIAGPLNLPGPATGPSVIAVLSDDDLDHGLDLRVGTGGDVVFADDTDDAERADTDDERAAGILLRSDDGALLSEVLDHAEQWLASRRVRDVAPGTDLRTALDLAPVPPRSPSLRPAFPVPQPHAVL